MVCEADRSGGDELNTARQPAELRKLREAGRHSEEGEEPDSALNTSSGRAPTRRLDGARMRDVGRVEARL